MLEKDQAMLVKDGQIEHLREQNVLLIQRLFGRKSEQTTDPDSPQLEFTKLGTIHFTCSNTACTSSFLSGSSCHSGIL